MLACRASCSRSMLPASNRGSSGGRRRRRPTNTGKAQPGSALDASLSPVLASGGPEWAAAAAAKGVSTEGGRAAMVGCAERCETTSAFGAAKSGWFYDGGASVCRGCSSCAACTSNCCRAASCEGQSCEVACKGLQSVAGAAGGDGDGRRHPATTRFLSALNAAWCLPGGSAGRQSRAGAELQRSRPSSATRRFPCKNI